MPIRIDRLESRPEDALDIEAGTQPHTVLTFLTTNDEQAFTQTEIREATDIPRGSIGVVLSRLEDRGLVRHHGRYWAIGDDGRLASYAAQQTASSVSTTDDYYGEGSGKLRETIIRYDPENVTRGEVRERLRQIDEAETEAEKQSIPERRVFGVGSKEDYERISEAAWGVANAFVGSSLHTGHELVACPDCGYEGHVDQAVFPGGTAHYSDAEEAVEKDGR